MDVDDIFVSVPCPHCDYEFEVSFLQIRLGEMVICPCCKHNIQLVDHEASAEISKREIDEAFDELNRTVTELSKSLNIRFKI